MAGPAPPAPVLQCRPGRLTHHCRPPQQRPWASWQTANSEPARGARRGPGSMGEATAGSQQEVDGAPGSSRAHRTSASCQPPAKGKEWADGWCPCGGPHLPPGLGGGACRALVLQTDRQAVLWAPAGPPAQPERAGAQVAGDPQNTSETPGPSSASPPSAYQLPGSTRSSLLCRETQGPLRRRGKSRLSPGGHSLLRPQR